jgi:hypothetical protein
MESQRSIERKYNKLMEDVSTNDFYKVDLTKRVNCYTCKCGHITKTKDVDPGVTPFLFKCESCGELAQSTFYTDIAIYKEPTIEWYRPDLKETMKHRNHPVTLDHILNGGLLDRKVQNL